MKPEPKNLLKNLKPNDATIIAQVRARLQALTNVSEKKMFGKLAFMVNDKLCIAVGKEDIMCRINPSLHDVSLVKTEGVPVIMRGRVMKGYFRIKNQDLQKKSQIEYWINLCLEFNKTLA